MTDHGSDVDITTQPTIAAAVGTVSVISDRQTRSVHFCARRRAPFPLCEPVRDL
jgi:hypothetical protein